MTVQYEEKDAVAYLTIHRPEVHNCLNSQTVIRLLELIDYLAERRSIRAVIVSGSGSKAFCAGADLKERMNMNEHQVKEFVLRIRDTFTALANLEKPVIAAVNGLALGGGAELAMACDLRVMSRHALFGLTETAAGIMPGAGGTQRLLRLAGPAVAKELIFTARKISAEEAYSLGLVNRVTEPQETLKCAAELAQEIGENAPLAVSQAKQALNRGMEVGLELGLQIETQAYEKLIPTKDRLEGLAAFAGKRKPVYRGE